MKKSAFTMIELVFVIVVIGIISAMIIPRLDRDNRFEAATQVLNHIKYTQHLAMTEDVYNDDAVIFPNWWVGRWQIHFYNTTCPGYAISRDNGLIGTAISTTPVIPLAVDAAVDPQTGKFLFTDAACTMPANPANFNKMNLDAFFDVLNIVPNATCRAALNGAGDTTISFDTLGRPYNDISIATGINGVIKQNCEIILNFNTPVGSFETIRIHPETGYACILSADANASGQFPCI